MQANGIVFPSLAKIAEYHPAFALAAFEGIGVRVDMRPLSVEFTTQAAIGQVLPASFAEIISSYSVFVGADLTLDPTSAFPGNVLKNLSDVTQARVTGITFTLLVRANGDDYAPVPEETPLQSVVRLLNAGAGVWALDNPDNVKARFTLASLQQPTALPFTAWLTLCFYVLGPEGQKYLCMDADTARKVLRDKYNVTCCRGE
jgi:hypothetical protein